MNYTRIFKEHVSTVSDVCCKYFIYIFKSRSDVVNIAMDVSGWWTVACHSRLVLLLGRRHGSRAGA
jgi:hypothetical protein